MTHRYAHIDALRAVAVLLVIWMHTSEVFVPIALPSVQNRLHEVAHFFDFGRIGVVVFFIISGFVIPASLRGPRGEGCRQFLIRRLFRLYPLYWLSIPFGLVTTWWMWGKTITPQAILWNLSMVQEAAGQPSIQGLYWTLQTELVFYGLCMALFALGWLQSTVALSLAIVLLGGMAALLWGLAALGIMPLATFSPALILLLVHLSLMFWGALVRHAIERTKLPRPVWLVLVGYCLAWLVLGLGASARHVMLADNAALFRTFVPYALGMTVFVLGATRLKLHAAWLVWLGGISYSLYLFHPVAQYSLSWLVQATDLVWLKGWTAGSYMLAATLLAISISAVTYRYVELPFQALGARLARGAMPSGVQQAT
jgi:peptidoglycan/LPS O-acetylase OafA/YrhL